jgi:replicative DNA helicase
MEMKAKARRLKMEQRLDIVFLDYIQLMRTGGRFENRNQEMSFISRSLKELAKELRIPVVGISQLSRAPEKGRREPKPQLSDLRESGAIEQDADVVMFLHRQEEESKDGQPAQQSETIEVQLIIAKQRQGPVGTIPLVFMKTTTYFAEMEKRREG